MIRHLRVRLLLLPLIVLTLCASNFVQAASVPAATLTPRVYLPLIKSAALSNQPTPPSSEELINAAVQAKKISAETGTVYKVYAVFGDSRLPAQYRGADRGREGSTLIADAVALLPTMSAANRAAVQPFLLAPSNPQSWFAQGGVQAAQTGAPPEAGTVLLGAATPHVKIWYDARFPAYKQRAQTIAAEMEATIWPKVTGVMGRAPLPDCGTTCADGGDDTRLDIYLVEHVRSFARSKSGCAPNSGFIVLQHNEPFSIIAHEFTHTVEFAFACADYAEYDWLFEATAEWAIDYVYPTDDQDPDYPQTNNEHGTAPWFFDSPELPLEISNDTHEYGAYLFFFFLTRSQNNPAIVRNIWEHATQANSLAVIDTASGGFIEQWPKFSLYNLNTESMAYYWNWDQLWGESKRTEYSMSAPQTQPFATKAPHLTANHYLFDFDDPKVKQIVVSNPLPEVGDEHATLWAMPLIDGQWGKPEDWTQFSRREFCRDLPGQNLEEVFLVVVNSQWEDRSAVFDAGAGKVETDTKCHLPDAVGTISYTGTGSKLVVGSSYTDKMTVNVRLRYDEASGHYLDVGSSYTYASTGHYVLQLGQCTQVGDYSANGSSASDGTDKLIEGAANWDDSNFWLGLGLPYKWTSTASTCGNTSTSSGTNTFFPHCLRDGIGDSILGFYVSGSNPLVYNFACTHKSNDSLNWVDTVTGTITRYR